MFVGSTISLLVTSFGKAVQESGVGIPGPWNCGVESTKPNPIRGLPLLPQENKMRRMRGSHPRNPHKLLNNIDITSRPQIRGAASRQERAARPNLEQEFGFIVRAEVLLDAVDG